MILEVDPSFQQNPDALKNIYVKSSNGTQVPLSAFTHFEQATSALAVNHQGQFPVVTLSFNLAPGRFARRRRERDPQASSSRSICPLSVHASFQGTAQAFQASLANEPLLILAALITVYIVLGVLYESYIHPITILSTLPSAGVGAILALHALPDGFQRHRADRHHPADRHRAEERHHDDRLRARGRAQGREAAAGGDLSGLPAAIPPIMMTTMAAMLGGLPLALGTRHRLGVAPAARHQHRRRLDVQPGAHSVHHSRRLSVRSTGWRTRLGRHRVGNPVESEATAD